MARPYKNVYQFKVTLEGVRPAVWRRIQVPETYSFWDLHVAIQSAMGWNDSHLHAFRVQDPDDSELTLIGIPDDDNFDGGPEYLPGWETPIADYLIGPGATARYEYDFGDGWEHLLVLEEILPKTTRVRYPRCLAGERACPPEDCGGVPGYETLRQILADPRHEDYEDMLTWVGGSFDAESFAPSKVRFANPVRRWDKVFGCELVPAPTNSALEALLDGPSPPDDALSYRETLGFLFAVACAPDMVPPSEWIPMIFGGDPGFKNKREADVLFGELFELYNEICSDVSAGRPELPRHCSFFRDAAANCAPDAPIREWSMGFIKGHLWLDQSWENSVPDDQRRDYMMNVMVLSFFSSRKIGEGLLAENKEKKTTLVELAESMRDAFRTAMSSYAGLGQALHRERLQQMRPAQRTKDQHVGRNDPCPCGSGKKFKKCCIAGRPDAVH